MYENWRNFSYLTDVSPSFPSNNLNRTKNNSNLNIFSQTLEEHKTIFWESAFRFSHLNFLSHEKLDFSRAILSLKRSHTFFFFPFFPTWKIFVRSKLEFLRETHEENFKRWKSKKKKRKTYKILWKFITFEAVSDRERDNKYLKHVSIRNFPGNVRWIFIEFPGSIFKFRSYD